ncbi:MAG TPA: cupin domain-containing protein [Candidatus Limnocylindria bacterium]|nr:cupin domain-containing protein [Candidatus Limnocylindria bacterium]
MFEPRIVDVKRAAKENSFFRKVLVTASKSQVVLMSLLPGEEIGTEIHQGDQLLYAVKGRAVAVVNRTKEPFEKGTMLCVPAGTEHNVINTGDEPFKLFTVYAPPEHADRVIHETKADAESAEAHVSA